MIPRPPNLTLFPYTTLFRSLCLRQRVRQLRLQAARERPGGRHQQPAIPVLSPWRVLKDGGRGACHVVHVRGDRKSTRLNSSHPSISYAVFCLKKKNKNNII